MTVIQTLKVESLRLRKERNPVAASITFVLSEIERVGKNAGNRETTEDEAVKTVQKIVATLRDNLQYRLSERDEEATKMQISILESVLPQMVSEEQVRDTIADLALEPSFMFNKGNVMKALRVKYGALIDLKRAGVILEEYIQ